MRQVLLAWTVSTDDVATREMYRKVGEGAATRCGCRSCRNFDTARPAHYPESFCDLLAAAAIDPRKETKVRLVTPLEQGHHLYSGTYLLCGEILAGRSFRGFPFVREEIDVFESVAPTVHVALRPFPNPGPPWSERPCVRLEFLVVLPWAIEGEGATPVELHDRPLCLSS